MPIINFNGKTYNSIEDMPAAERKAFEQMSQLLVDANGNGIPDLLEGDMVKNVLTVHSSQANITVNGQTYTSFNELPPDTRKQVDGAFKILSSLGLLDGISETQAAPAAYGPKVKSQPSQSQQSPSAIEEEPGTSTFSMVLIGIVLCFAVVAATIAIFVFTNR